MNRHSAFLPFSLPFSQPPIHSLSLHVSFLSISADNSSNESMNTGRNETGSRRVVRGPRSRVPSKIKEEKPTEKRRSDAHCHRLFSETNPSDSRPSPLGSRERLARPRDTDERRPLPAPVFTLLRNERTRDVPTREGRKEKGTCHIL